MLWLDVIYAKVGEISSVLYVGLGNIGTEITSLVDSIAKVLGA